MNAEDDCLDPTAADLRDLREQVAYLQQTLAAIRSGEVDAVVVGEPDREHIYSLTSADRPYRVIVERMGEGAATVSDRGVILYANPQLAHFLGVDRDTMVGRDVTSYVDADEQAALASLLDTPSTESRRAELSIATTDGSGVPVLVAATALDLDGVLVRCLVFTDLTMRKLVERQLADEAAQVQRQRVAREVNDTIVQGLVAAEMALDLGQVDYARARIARTSSQARGWIGDLAGELTEDHQLAPGMAVRTSPARPTPEAR
jgi:PAS domain S-box-containing protein